MSAKLSTLQQTSWWKLNPKCLLTVYYSALHRTANNALYTTASALHVQYREDWDPAIRMTFCSAIYCPDRSVRKSCFTPTPRWRAALTKCCSDQVLLLLSSYTVAGYFYTPYWLFSFSRTISVSSDSGEGLLLGNTRKCGSIDGSCMETYNGTTFLLKRIFALLQYSYSTYMVSPMSLYYFFCEYSIWNYRNVLISSFIHVFEDWARTRAYTVYRAKWMNELTGQSVRSIINVLCWGINISAVIWTVLAS